jgi:transposase
VSAYPNNAKDTTKSRNSKTFHASKDVFSYFIKHILNMPEFKIENIQYGKEVISIYVSSRAKTAVCPYCGHRSGKVHSFYERTLEDLPFMGKETRIIFKARKMFCTNGSCFRKTFAEQPGEEVFRYRRRTRRCEMTVTRQGLSSSSENASRLLSMSGIRLSQSTVLRDLHRLHVSPYRDIRQIGVDDWAQRKGMTYGSIIIDPAGRHPIDLLGDREEESFRDWISVHPSVSLVSRDRSTDYSSAIASTGRPITEVADKFHLVKNIMERITRLVGLHYADYRKAVLENKDEVKEPDTGTADTVSVKEEKTVCIHPVSNKPDMRQVMFDEVKQLQSKGFKPATIARKLGIARMTSTKFCRLDSLPPRSSKLRKQYCKYNTFVERQYADGKSLRAIFKDIYAMGFNGSLTPFYDHYRYLEDVYKDSRSQNKKVPEKKKRPVDKRPALMPIKAIGIIIGKKIRKRTNAEDDKLISILSGFTWFHEMYEATDSFYGIITGHDATRLLKWMKLYWKTGIGTLKTFLIGIKRDYKAVVNTIKYNVTNGITEGFVNKLKVLKRSMYGRASIELLKNKLVLEHIFFN